MMRDAPCTGPENVLEAKELVRKLRTIVAAALTWPVQSACDHFVCSDKDPGVLMKMRERREVKIDVMPARTDTIAYLNMRVG